METGHPPGWERCGCARIPFTITQTHWGKHRVGAPRQEPNLPVNSRVNYHPYFLAQHFVGRLKAFPEDFPSPAGTTRTNCCFIQPVSSTLGFLCSPSPAPQLNWLLPQGHLCQAGLCCCGVTWHVLMSSPSPCHSSILPNDLQAVPARHQLLSGIMSLGGRYRSTPESGFHAAPRAVGKGRQQAFP